MKKLLIVVGAGASVDFGLPSVAEVGRILSREAQTRFPLALEPDTNLYDRVAHEVEAYWASFSKPALARRPHFENVLYALMVLASAYPHGDFTSPLGALVSPKQIPDVNWLGRNIRKVDDTLLSDLATDCADLIIKEFRARCRNLSISHRTE